MFPSWPRKTARLEDTHANTHTHTHTHTHTYISTDAEFMVIAHSQSSSPSHSLGCVAPQVMAMIENDQDLIRAAA